MKQTHRPVFALCAMAVWALAFCGQSLAITDSPSITSGARAVGSLTTEFRYNITATNSPTSFNATGLPMGLNINTQTGVIAGTPAKTGRFTAVISAANANGSGSRALAITIVDNSPRINGDATISGMFDGSPLVIRTASKFAGAIYSLNWKGVEFINSNDHGRLLQSASDFDGGGECFNPTEAGSAHDGSGPTSTSRLLAILKQGPNVLLTTTQMAFWLAPGQKDGRRCVNGAVNKTILSNHRLSKNITVGFAGKPNVISYLVNFATPPDERHTKALFEALTGYMPGMFSKFWTYDGATLRGAPSLGEKKWWSQPLPIIVGTPDGRFCLGIYSPDLPEINHPNAYATVVLPTAHGLVTKWNMTFTYKDADVQPGQAYSFKMFLIVGNVAQVQESMKQLITAFTLLQGATQRLSLGH